MSANQELPLDLMVLPDWAVLNDQQTVALLGFSIDTLNRLDRAGDEPPRVRLSPRRYGRPVGELRKWIQRTREQRHRSKARIRFPAACGRRATRSMSSKKPTLPRSLSDLPMLCTPNLAAEVMGLTRQQVRSLLRLKKIAHVPVGKRLMIPHTAIEDFIVQSTVPPCHVEIPERACASLKNAGVITSSGLTAAAAASARLARTPRRAEFFSGTARQWRGRRVPK